MMPENAPQNSPEIDHEIELIDELKGISAIKAKENIVEWHKKIYDYANRLKDMGYDKIQLNKFKIYHALICSTPPARPRSMIYREGLLKSLYVRNCERYRLQILKTGFFAKFLLF